MTAFASSRAPVLLPSNLVQELLFRLFALSVKGDLEPLRELNRIWLAEKGILSECIIRIVDS